MENESGTHDHPVTAYEFLKLPFPPKTLKQKCIKNAKQKNNGNAITILAIAPPIRSGRILSNSFPKFTAQYSANAENIPKKNASIKT